MRTFLRSSGSALPGRIVEILSPKFLPKMCSKMKYGVLLVTGTNGKTTTTHIIANLLESQGLKVFTNKSGSNFTRGIASEFVHHASIFGNPRADIAVLELDEAHGVHFAKLVNPNYSVFLNVMRDQLDRFGEIDHTAELLGEIAKLTKKVVILNREDPRISNLRQVVKKGVTISYFGLSPELRKIFLNDDELYSGVATSVYDYKQIPETWEGRQKYKTPDEVVLNSYDEQSASYLINEHRQSVNLAIKGIHNVYNSAAAILVVRSILGNYIDGSRLLIGLSSVQTAFGRGEQIVSEGAVYDIILVKNPAGFRIGLQSFEKDDVSTLICINDDYADGRDVSWLWDVDFSVFKDRLAPIVLSGHRAFDMQLRLEYDNICVSFANTDIKTAVNALKNATDDKHRRIYATYTAMLAIRQLLLGKKAAKLG